MRLRCRTAEISFFDLRAPLDEPAAARDQAAQHADAFVAAPDPRDEVGGEQVGEHACVDLVGLHARVADGLQLARVGEHDLSCVRLDEARDGERVAGRLQHHAVVRRQAGRKELQVCGRGGDASRGARPAAVGDRHLAEVAVYVEPDRSAHLLPPQRQFDGGRRRARTTRTDPRS